LAQVLSPRHLRLNNYQDQATKLATFGIQAFEGEGDTFHKEKPQKNAWTPKPVVSELGLNR
jgi:hypothetical protein